MLIFILVYAIATMFFVAGVILTLTISFILASSTSTNTGIILGVISVFFGASLGATLAFLSSRFFLKDFVSSKLDNKYFVSLDSAMKKKGLRILLLLRLSPLIPFSALVSQNHQLNFTLFSIASQISYYAQKRWL